MRVDEALTKEQWDMVTANLGLVGKACGMYAPRWDEEDAYQDGLFGLMEAVKRYQPELGFRFSTFAMPWIRNKIQRGRGQREGINKRREHFQGAAKYVPPVSLDRPVDQHDSDRGGTLGDFVASELNLEESIVDEMDAQVERERLKEALKSLTLAERQILGMDAADVARRLGVTPARIRQRRKEILRRLRTQLREAA